MSATKKPPVKSEPPREAVIAALSSLRSAGWLLYARPDKRVNRVVFAAALGLGLKRGAKAMGDSLTEAGWDVWIGGCDRSGGDYREARQNLKDAIEAARARTVQGRRTPRKRKQGRTP